MNTWGSGLPPDDSHNAHSTGHNSSQMPIGLFSLVSAAYAPSFAAAPGSISVTKGVAVILWPSHCSRWRIGASGWVGRSCSMSGGGVESGAVDAADAVTGADAIMATVLM